MVMTRLTANAGCKQCFWYLQTHEGSISQAKIYLSSIIWKRILKRIQAAHPRPPCKYSVWSDTWVTPSIVYTNCTYQDQPAQVFRLVLACAVYIWLKTGFRMTYLIFQCRSAIDSETASAILTDSPLIFDTFLRFKDWHDKIDAR